MIDLPRIGTGRQGTGTNHHSCSCKNLFRQTCIHIYKRKTKKDTHPFWFGVVVEVVERVESLESCLGESGDE